MSILYFKPDRVPVSELRHVVATKVRKERTVSTGPSKQAGTVYSIGLGDEVGYYPERQEWHDSGQHGIWFGWFSNSPPVPADMARDKMLSVSRPVTLEDGNRWLIPCVRAFMDNTNGDVAWGAVLPRYLDLDEHDNWRYGKVVDRYAVLDGYASRWWDIVMAPSLEAAMSDEQDGLSHDEGGILTVMWTGDACYEALRANYWITKRFIARRKLIEGASEGEIMNALIDLQTLQDRLDKKKREAVGV